MWPTIPVPFLRRALPLLLGGLLSVAAVTPTRAVDLAIVLLNDVSGSIDSDEFNMIKEGYRAAFSDPEIIAAVEAHPGGIALSYVEFSGRNEIVALTGWQVLTDDITTRAFGEAVALAPRSSTGNTAMAASLREATRMLTSGEFESARKVIDIASDNASDFGRAARARDAAVAAGITINAIPIIDSKPLGTIDGRLTYAENDWPPGGVVAYYQRNVIGGPGAFIVEAHDYAAFPEALKRKLLLELRIAATEIALP